MKGYTLIELLVVLVIMAFLLLIAFPSYRLVMNHLKAEREVSRLYQMILFSRESAMEQSKTAVLLPINHNWSNGYSLTVDQKQITYETNDPRFSTIKWRDFQHRNRLEFNSLGFTNSDNGTFYYETCDHRFKRKIVINIAGRIRVR